MKDFNFNVALKMLLLLGFASFFLYSVFSGTYMKYVHPRIVPYLIFTAVIMIITLILMSGNLFKSHKSQVNSWGLIFFIIPLIMSFTIPAASLSSETQILSNIQVSNGNNSTKENSTTDNSIVTENDRTEDDDASINNIVIYDNNYYSYLYKFFINPDEYIGNSIEIVGFVYKNDIMDVDQFVVARYVMTCCAADMLMCGLICNWDNASDFESDTWVNISGVKGTDEYDGINGFCINVVSIEQTDAPLQEYIYPY